MFPENTRNVCVVVVIKQNSDRHQGSHLSGISSLLKAQGHERNAFAIAASMWDFLLWVVCACTCLDVYSCDRCDVESTVDFVLPQYACITRCRNESFSVSIETQPCRDNSSRKFPIWHSRCWSYSNNPKASVLKCYCLTSVCYSLPQINCWCADLFQKANPVYTFVFYSS